MLKKILIVAVALVALMGAPAAAQYGDTFSATISNTNPGPGETVTIEGSCSVGEEVEVTLDMATTARAAQVLGTIVVDADGTFSGPVTIPADLAPGTYTVTATCGGEVLSIDITVGDSTTPTPPDQGGTGPLARTGADGTSTLLKVAGGLVLAGAAFALVATKRRTATA